MARILIITAWYAPFIHPRAYRWTRLAEYWAEQGEEVHVLCARPQGLPAFAEEKGVHVHRVGFDSLKELVYAVTRNRTGRGRVGVGVRAPSRLARLLGWFYTTVWKNLYFPDDACLWYFPARRALLQLQSRYAFDRVISVSLPFTGHMLGHYLKRRHPEIRWLADIGDPYTIQAAPVVNPRLYGRLARKWESRVLREADAVAVTHRGAVRAYQYVFGALAEKIAVIPPISTPLPAIGNAAGFEEKDRPPGVLHLGYFGALYAPVRTPDGFLRLLDDTFRVQPDLANRIRVHFFGEIFPEFYNVLSRHPCIRLHGLQSRATVAAAMQSMDLLVNIGNTTTYQLPSKSADYLAAGKPVLHLSYVADDPFVDFWGDHPGLFVLPVRENQITAEHLKSWLLFLGSLPEIHIPPDLRWRRMLDGSVAVVAQAYLRLLTRQ